ncbi:MAG: hypothetical protein WD048_01615 [Chitinophagales bacterium]
MGKVNHRKKLIDKIKNIDDEEVIDEIYRFLEISFDDTVYQLNDEQRKEIEQARAEIKAGKGISSEEVNKEIDEWLKK